LDCRLAKTNKNYGDVRDQTYLSSAAQDVDAIIHLAAISRVQWGDAHPELCWETNVGGTENAVRAAARARRNPVLIVASSREVYGEPDAVPVDEDAPAAPVNVYGRSKVACEQAALAGREVGVNAAVVRFSNVYGRMNDHPDRVVPAFARAASRGSPMQVCGSDLVFDFTHVEDTAAGTIALLEALLAGERHLPPIHFVTGRPTTLGRLAQIANEAGDHRSVIIEAPVRSNDVMTFVGDPSRAERLLGWRPRIAVESGVRQLVDDFASSVVEPLDSVLRQPARHRLASLEPFGA
jgi:UDP-glucose 4-epimerase